jgi:hypothetical protein
MWALIAAVIAVAASAGVYYQQRKMEAQAKKQAQEAKAVQISGHDSNRGLYTVYGKALIGSTTVWKKVSDKQTRMTQTGFTTFSRGTGDLINGTRDLKSNRFLYRAVSLCAGPIQSVENILIDDEGYQSSRFGQGDDRHFAASVSLGPTAGQNFSAMRTSFSSDFGAWGSTFTGKGVAYAIERLYLDNDKPAYQGEPSTKYLVKGRKLYDPRKDSTSSVYDATLGTSSHRFDTPSTWEWSDNPVLALLDYMTNSEYGRGLALSVIDLPSIADSADKCDVLVDIPGRLTNDTGSSYQFYDAESGEVITVQVDDDLPNHRREQGSTAQQKRFRLNIAIDPSKELLDNIQEILNVFRGNLSYANGKYRVHMADVASPVLTIGDDDIITGLKISNGDRAQRMNRATIKFINANKQHKTDQVSWPSLDSNEDDGLYDTYLTEDQGEKLHKTFTIKGCTDYYQAQDTAEFLVRDSRSNLTVAGTFGSRCFGLVPGDVVSLTYDSAGYSGKYFRVMQVAIDLNSMNVNLQLKEYDSSVYTWNDARGTEPEGLSWQEEVVNAAPITPVIGTLSSTTRTRADGSTALTLTVPFSNIPEQAQYVDVEWGINGTDQYNSQVVFDTENINQVEVPIERDNVTYAVRVRYFITDSAGTLMSSNFATDTITVGTLTGTKLGGIEEGATANNIYQQADEPTGGTYNDGDIWIDTDDGYRMYLRSGGAWVDRADTRIATAITDAAGAQATADGKVVTFFQDAEPADASSSTGDLWIDTNDSNKLYRYNGTSWDSVRDSGIASAISAASTAQSTADGKIVTFYQDDEPADASSSTGDLWFDTNDNNKLYRYNGTDWVSARDSGIAAAISAAAGAQSTADGKVVTFYQDDEPAAASSSTGDLWIDTNDNNKLYRFNGTSWDSVRDAGIASAISSAATAQSTADGKIVTFYQDDEPADASSSTGDLWFDTNDDNKLYRYNGTDWVSARDAGIADALANAATAQSTADGKIVTFYQDGEPAAASSSEGDLWIDTNDSNKLYRFNGTDWVAARDSGIASAISDAATAQATADGKVTTFYAASSATPTPEGTGDLWYQTDTQLFFRYNGSAWQEVASYNTGALADLDTVDTPQIEDNAVDIAKIADTLQSTNYSAGSAGWKLTTDGTFEAGNGTFRGAVTATSGEIGGLTIGSDKIYLGTGTFNNTNTGFYLDDSAQFSLKDKLSFDGTDLTVSGDITAASFTLSSGATLTDSDGQIANVAINLAFPVDGLTYYWPCNSIADTDGDGDEELQEMVSGKTGIHSGSAPTLSTDSPSGNAVVNASGSGWTLLNDTDADALEGANGFAWSIWFKSETTTGESQARIIGRDASDGWALIIDQSGTSQTLTLYGEPGTESMGTVTTNEWHHFCLSEDGNGTISGYLDGELIGTESYTPVDSSRPVVIGCNTEASINTAASVFIGKLTEVRAYNRALTAIEVRALYKVPAGGLPQKIDGDLIVDGTITASQIAANAVTAGKINVSSLADINADAGTISGGSVGGTIITSSKLYQGTGTHNNTNTGFYLDSSGNFSLKDKLSFDGTTLSVDGNVTVDEFVKAGSGSTAAVMSGRAADNFAFWAGADFDANGGASGANAPFRVTRAGKVIMTNFALYSTTGQKLFDSTDGLLGLPSTQVAASTGSLVSSVSDELTGATDYATIQLSSTQTITVDFDYPLNYLFASGSSEANAYGQVATSITVTIQKSTDASTWSTFGAVTFNKTDSSSASTSQYYVQKQTVYLGSEFGGGTLYFASLQPGGAVDDGNVLNGNVSASLATGTHYLRMQVSYGGSGLAASGIPSTTEARSINLTTSGAGFTVDSNGNVSDGVSTSATTGWVTSNFQGKDSSGNVVIAGNLTVNGTTTTLNTATLDVEDKNITLNYGAGDTSASANGAGITIQDAVNASTDASILWDGTSDEFDFSHPVQINRTTAGGELLHLRNSYDGGYRHDLLIENTNDRDAGITIKTTGGQYEMWLDSNGDDSLIFSPGDNSSDIALELYQNKDVDIGGNLDVKQGIKFEPNGYDISADTDGNRTLFTFTRSGSASWQIWHDASQHLNFIPNNTSYKLQWNGERILTTADLSSIDRTILDSTDDIASGTANSPGNGFYAWGSSAPTNAPDDYAWMLDINDGSQPQQWVGAYGGAANRVDLYARRRTGGTWDTTWTKFWNSADFSSTDVSNWGTAYGWGNHASAGYLTSLSFDGLTSKTGGTGDYKTTGKFRSSDNIVSGEGSGGVALTVNDSKGNANVTFNHADGIPEQNGNAARIEVNTDSSTGATMYFELKSGVTDGVSVDLTNIFHIDENGLDMDSGKGIKINGTEVISSSRDLTPANITATGSISGGGKIKTQHDRSDSYSDTPSWTEQDWDTLVLYNGNSTTSADQMSSIFMRADGGGSASSRIVLRNDNSGNGRLYFMMRSGAHTDVQQPKMLITDDGYVTISDNATTYNERLFVDGTLRAEDGIKIGATQIIDSSRNLTSIGTISSGAITSSGRVYGTEFDLPSGGMLDWANGDARIVEGLVNNYSLSFQTYDGSNVTTALRLDGDNTATFAGAITSTAGTADSSPNILRILSATESNTGQGDVYSGIEFGVVGAENSSGALTNGVNAAIKSIDTRSGETSFEDAGLGFYTTDSEGGPTLRMIITDDGGVHVSNDGNIDSVAAGNLNVDGNVYGNQLYAGGSRIANSSGYLTATVVVADDVDFVVSDSTDAITNIIWRDHSAQKLYLGTPYAEVELRSDLNLQSGLGIKINGTEVISSARDLTPANITTTGDITLGSGATLIRSTHQSGHLEGGYNNIGNNKAKSNPIYTIGSSYNPAEDTLSSMYGIGYAKQGDATYLSSVGSAGWGMYVAANGSATVFLNGDTGQVASTGGYVVGTTTVIDASRNLSAIGTITASGLITTSNSLHVGSGYNLSWGGAYTDGKPTIAANSNTIYFYPTGNVSGQRLYLTAAGLINAGTFTSGAITTSGNLTATGATIGGNQTGTTLTIEASDTAGAPATTTQIQMIGYEGRGIGTFYEDVSYSGKEWFAGMQYNGGFDAFVIGYSASGGQAEYGSNAIARFRGDGSFEIGTTKIIDASRNLTNIGTISSGAITSATTNDDAAFFTSSHATTTNFYIRNSNATTGNTANLYFAPANNVAGSYIRTQATEDFSVSANRSAKMVLAVRENGTWREPITINPDESVQFTGTISSGVISVEGASGGQNLSYASNFAAASASIQLTLERTTDSVGWGAIGADSTYCFAAWTSTPARRFSVTHGGVANATAGYQVNGTDVINSARTLTVNGGNHNISGGTTTFNVGRGDVLFENNSNSNASGAGITLRTALNPSGDGSIFDVRSSGQAIRLFVGQDLTSSGYNPFYVGLNSSTSGQGTASNYAIELATNGNIIAEGNVTAYGSASDIRLKENIEPITDALGKVKRLDGVTFNYKKDGSRSTGVIAQQVQEVLPEVIYESAEVGKSENGEKFLAVRYGQMMGLAIEAIKELSAEVDSLKVKLKELEDGNH